MLAFVGTQLGVCAEQKERGEDTATEGKAESAAGPAGVWVIGPVYVPLANDGRVPAALVPAARVELRVARAPMRDGGVQQERDGVYAAVDQWRSLVAAYFPPWAVEQAMRVLYGTATCPNGESGGDPAAYNAGNYGGFQIAYPTHRDKLVRVAGVDDPALLFDPEINTAVAYLVYEESGGGTWLPWSCRP